MTNAFKALSKIFCTISQTYQSWRGNGKMIVGLKNDKEKTSNNNGTHSLKDQLYDFLEDLPRQEGGVTHICSFFVSLANQQHSLSDILYEIGEDPRLYFWLKLVIGSLSFKESDQLTKTLRSMFPKEGPLMQEVNFFFLSHQKKLIQEIASHLTKQVSLSPLQSHEGTA